MSPAETRFKQTYITSSEIREMLNTSRTAISNAVLSGRLPDAIPVNNFTIWERENIMPHVEALKASLLQKRGY